MCHHTSKTHTANANRSCTTINLSFSQMLRRSGANYGVRLCKHSLSLPHILDPACSEPVRHWKCSQSKHKIGTTLVLKRFWGLCEVVYPYVKSNINITIGPSSRLQNRKKHLHAVTPLFSPAGNVTMLWCACSTSVFKPATSRFIKNLACSGICAGLACVPFDIALGVSPRCCWWLHTLVVCKAVKFLQKLCCSITVLSFSAIALDRSTQNSTYHSPSLWFWCHHSERIERITLAWLVFEGFNNVYSKYNVIYGWLKRSSTS